MQASPSNTSEILIPKAFKFLREPKRNKVLYGGRGGAKSHNVARTLLLKGMERPLRVICAREIQRSIADSVHQLLDDLINQYGWRYFYQVKDKEIIGRNGTQFKFRGLKHNTTDLKSLEGADILWIEEAENVSDKSYEIVIPTIRKEGSEIWVTFNPKNPTDPTWIRFVQNPDEDTAAVKVSYLDNPFFPQVLEKERLKLLKNDPVAYEHVWLGNFDQRYSGKVYAKWVSKLLEEGRICDRVKHDPAYPVYTAWDLGYDDATAIIFYQIGSGEIFIIDYYESNHEDIKHYCEVLYGKEIVIDARDPNTGAVTAWHFGDGKPDHVEKSKHRQAYNYHAHYAPHDAAYKLQAAGGRSIISQAHNLGVKMFSIPATTVQNNIESLRATLPRMWINSENCKDLISAWMNYHFEYDEDKKIFKKVPNHDWSSHAANAGELMAKMWKESPTTQAELDRREVVATFHKLRRENDLVQEDPYRMRSK